MCFNLQSVGGSVVVSLSDSGLYMYVCMSSHILRRLWTGSCMSASHVCFSCFLRHTYLSASSLKPRLVTDLLGLERDWQCQIIWQLLIQWSMNLGPKWRQVRDASMVWLTGQRNRRRRIQSNNVQFNVSRMSTMCGLSMMHPQCCVCSGMTSAKAWMRHMRMWDEN